MVGIRQSASSPRTKVLLLEDDAAIRRSLQLLLHGQGYEVCAFANGYELLVATRSADAKLLIADYRLGEEDGLTVLRHLRSRGWNCPAIMITGDVAESIGAAAREAGFDIVLRKPVRSSDLVNTIIEVLN